MKRPASDVSLSTRKRSKGSEGTVRQLLRNHKKEKEVNDLSCKKLTKKEEKNIFPSASAKGRVGLQIKRGCSDEKGKRRHETPLHTAGRNSTTCVFPEVTKNEIATTSTFSLRHIYVGAAILLISALVKFYPAFLDILHPCNRFPGCRSQTLEGILDGSVIFNAKDLLSFFVILDNSDDSGFNGLLTSLHVAPQANLQVRNSSRSIVKAIEEMSIDYRREGPNSFSQPDCFQQSQNLLPILSSFAVDGSISYSEFLCAMAARRPEIGSIFFQALDMNMDGILTVNGDNLPPSFLEDISIATHEDTFFDKTNRAVPLATFTQWLNKFGNRVDYKISSFCGLQEGIVEESEEIEMVTYSMSSTEDIEFEEVKELVEAEKTKDEKLENKSKPNDQNMPLGPIIGSPSLKHPCWRALDRNRDGVIDTRDLLLSTIKRYEACAGAAANNVSTIAN